MTKIRFATFLQGLFHPKVTRKLISNMGVSIAGSITNKAETQDAYGIFTNPRYGFRGNILADGIGSMPSAEIASIFFVREFVKYLEDSEQEYIDLNILFSKLHDNFIKYVFNNNYHQKFDNLNEVLGTTLILTIEYEKYIEIGYIGNGGIFHIRGNFHKFNPLIYHIPWVAYSNLLNPDSVVGEEGKETLVKFFSPNENKAIIQPTIVRISKDDINFGDIILTCTDGIFSYDQANCGVYSGGRPKYLEDRWMPYSANYALLIDHFRQLFNEEKIINQDILQQQLGKSLNFMKDNEMLDDDATVGIIFTNKFLAKL